MSTEDSRTRSPFTTWYFIASAVAVGLVVVVAVVLAIINSRDDGGSASPVPTQTSQTEAGAPSSTPQSSEAAGSTSICGLAGEDAATTLTTAPEASWQYQGTTAYPTSSTAGPGSTDASGVRSCFQRSVTGAVFAAANAVAQGTESSTAATWLDSFMTKDSPRDGLSGTAGGDFESGVRANVTGFKVLDYTGETASIDMAVTGSSAGQSVDLSMIYNLRWEDGDWKLVVTNPATLIDVSTIPNLAGYISWGP